MQGVFEEQGVRIIDRVAFGCRFLGDADLHSYIDEETVAVIRGGRLDGLLLTGLTPQGVDLLAAFVDRTADLQTASVLTSVALTYLGSTFASGVCVCVCVCVTLCAQEHMSKCV